MTYCNGCHKPVEEQEFVIDEFGDKFCPYCGGHSFHTIDVDRD